MSPCSRARSSTSSSTGLSSSANTAGPSACRQRARQRLRMAEEPIQISPPCAQIVAWTPSGSLSGLGERLRHGRLAYAVRPQDRPLRGLHPPNPFHRLVLERRRQSRRNSGGGLAGRRRRRPPSRPRARAPCLRSRSRGRRRAPSPACGRRASNSVYGRLKRLQSVARRPRSHARARARREPRARPPAPGASTVRSSCVGPSPPESRAGPRPGLRSPPRARPARRRPA